MSDLYATDGLCHNSNKGTYGHECSKPAVWLGTNRDGFTMGYCERRKAEGDEARDVTTWAAIAQPTTKTRMWLAVGIHRGGGLKDQMCTVAIYSRFTRQDILLGQAEAQHPWMKVRYVAELGGRYYGGTEVATLIAAHDAQGAGR